MNLIVKMKFGSHLYGTNTEKSDVDYKGVFLPSKEEILLNNIPKCYNFSSGDYTSKNNSDDIDEEIYSLHYFINLACQGQTAALDMLHAPEEMILQSSDIWRIIVKHKEKFYTKNLSAFIDYARKQAAKYGIKGSRLNSTMKVLELLKANNPKDRMRNIWDQLPIDEHCYYNGADPNGFRQYQVCGKLFQESAAIGYVIPILSKFYEAYGHRAKLAAENKNIDWKAVSHALRAAIQVKEILTEGTIIFPLRDATFLKQVKYGELDYKTVVAPTLESMMDECEELIKESTLPETVNEEYWNGFLCEILETKLFDIKN